jgi:hypothetical protein
MMLAGAIDATNARGEWRHSASVFSCSFMAPEGSIVVPITFTVDAGTNSGDLAVVEPSVTRQESA